MTTENGPPDLYALCERIANALERLCELGELSLGVRGQERPVLDPHEKVEDWLSTTTDDGEADAEETDTERYFKGPRRV